MTQNQPSHFAKDFTASVFIKGQARYQVFLFSTFTLSAFSLFRPQAWSL
jgi:hypothetical protein